MTTSGCLVLCFTTLISTNEEDHLQWHIGIRGNSGAAQESDVAELKRLNATFIHNFVTNDTAAHNRIIHKDFVSITSEGQYIDRKKCLDCRR